MKTSNLIFLLAFILSIAGCGKSDGTAPTTSTAVFPKPVLDSGICPAGYTEHGYWGNCSCVKTTDGVVDWTNSLACPSN